MTYYGIVVPIREFFEAICFRETKSKDLSKLYEKIPIILGHPENWIDEGDEARCLKFIEDKDWVKYLKYNLNHDVFYSDFATDENDVGYWKFKSYNNGIKTWWIFIGCKYSYKCEDINKYMEIDKEYNNKNVILDIKNLGLTNYEIYTFTLPYVNIIRAYGTFKKYYLPGNYVPKYRKL